MRFSRKSSIVAGRWGSRLELRNTVDELDSLLGDMTCRALVKSKPPRKRSIKEEYVESVTRLVAFRAQCESEWGEATTRIDLAKLGHGELYAVRKALFLRKFRRMPEDITEGFLTASGSVDGKRIEPREIYWQRFRPLAQPLGQMVVVSPSFGETSRDYYELALQLNRLGYDTLLMDHQWGGYSEGHLDELDSGFGVARDVASVSAFAQRLMEREYEQRPRCAITLIGKGLGASAGALGAAVLNDLSLLRLDGWPMPKGVNSVLIDPWLGGEATLLAKSRTLASLMSVVAYPRSSEDSEIIHLDSTKNRRGHVRAITRAGFDLKRLCELLESGSRSDGDLYIIRFDKHLLGDPLKSAWLASLYEDRAILKMVDNRHIPLPMVNALNGYVIAGLKSLRR